MNWGDSMSFRVLILWDKVHDSNQCSAHNIPECGECSQNFPHVLSNVYGRE